MNGEFFRSALVYITGILVITAVAVFLLVNLSVTGSSQPLQNAVPPGPQPAPDAVAPPSPVAASPPPNTGAASPPAPAPPPSDVPAPPLQNSAPKETSINWAGYAVQTSLANPQSNSVTGVEGSWNVSAVECSSSSRDYSSAFWVGIDGISSRSVEQIGTDSDCYHGTPAYYAWYEMYPNGSVDLNMALYPGDKINAKIEYLGGSEFRLSLADVSTGESFSVIEYGSDVARSSAEWIAEAPVSTNNNRVLPLPQFGNVDFNSAYVTVNGVMGPINGSSWEYVPIVMENTRGIMKATPTGLIDGGTAFSIIWNHT